jgi:hypothetical protein
MSIDTLFGLCNSNEFNNHPFSFYIDDSIAVIEWKGVRVGGDCTTLPSHNEQPKKVIVIYDCCPPPYVVKCSDQSLPQSESVVMILYYNSGSGRRLRATKVWTIDRKSNIMFDPTCGASESLNTLLQALSYWESNSSINEGEDLENSRIYSGCPNLFVPALVCTPDFPNCEDRDDGAVCTANQPTQCPPGSVLIGNVCVKQYQPPPDPPAPPFSQPPGGYYPSYVGNPGDTDVDTLVSYGFDGDYTPTEPFVPVYTFYCVTQYYHDAQDGYKAKPSTQNAYALVDPPPYETVNDTYNSQFGPAFTANTFHFYRAKSDGTIVQDLNIDVQTRSYSMDLPVPTCVIGGCSPPQTSLSVTVEFTCWKLENVTITNVRKFLRPSKVTRTYLFPTQATTASIAATNSLGTAFAIESPGGDVLGVTSPCPSGTVITTAVISRVVVND